MHTLSARELLCVWEQGLAQPTSQRVLTLLAAACPDTPPDTLANLNVGRRDALLLTLRERTFGSKLLSLATCPACGERLEFNLNVADIQVTTDSAPTEPLSVSVADYEVRFRLPTSLDLAIVAGCEDVAVTRKLLLERCFLAVHHNDEESSADQVPVEVVDAVMQRMAEADPQADVQLALSCPLCGHQWEAALDIASFFWAEINAWASRILHEVHTLASAYGWRETDILAMSPWRRQVYLEMVGG